MVVVLATGAQGIDVLLIAGRRPVGEGRGRRGQRHEKDKGHQGSVARTHLASIASLEAIRVQ
jgi:hypothetical protein